MIEELYKKYYEELINWCHSMTGNLYTAEELVHEAFLRAMLHEDTLSTLKEQQSRSWLYRTVKNLYVDRLRHGKKEIISDEFSQLQIDSEELVRLEWEKLLETLPDLEGVIFSLRYLEGYNSKQIQEHTLLIVNGALNIHSGTKEILEKYEKIHVNGSVRCAESISGYLTKLSASNSVSIYPDDCMILNDTFIVDKYFPLRAKEDNKYYVKDKVIIQDKSVDMQKLVEKNVRFVTEQLIIPEEMVESCIELFDEKVNFVVIPAGMALHYGDAVLNEELLKKEGDSIYVYGNLKVPEDVKLDTLDEWISKLMVKETVVLMKNQEASFKKLNVDYQRLEFEWEGRIIENKPNISIDKILLENSSDQVLVRNIATVKIAQDVRLELILNYLRIQNCAQVLCNEEQKSVIVAISQNVAQIGEADGEELPGKNIGIQDLLFAKVINADSYIL